MYLKELQIINYKNLKSCKFFFNKGTNTIIGENDSGKSNAMTALRILLDDSFYFSPKTLMESDFSKSLGNWKGHWIIISAIFDEFSGEDLTNEVCSEIIGNAEVNQIVKADIRSGNSTYGCVTLFIRPSAAKRNDLAKASPADFDKVRESITIADYEFYYTCRSNTDFTIEKNYRSIVGDLENKQYVTTDDSSIIGVQYQIQRLLFHISVVFIDALRDVSSELKKYNNPIRRIFDAIRSSIDQSSIDDIKQRIADLNRTIASIDPVSNIGLKLNEKLNEIIGLVYSPDITLNSRMKEDINSLAKFLTIVPEGDGGIELLGLGHLNILYIALKMIEFDISKEREILNIMIIEEPEAHIHTHIQKTLFDSLKASQDYTQVLMTSHSVHLSEISKISDMNVLKTKNNLTTVMRPANMLDDFGQQYLNLNNLRLTQCLERYLDAKRSVLLFSKGVILVEGDAEEILIPEMVRKAFGVSLDELGIGLINISGIAFEYVASIFDEKRLQRYCAIITDGDNAITEKDMRAEKLGENRAIKLDKMYGNNPWVKTFFAPHTFEVEFAECTSNRQWIISILQKSYVDENVLKEKVDKLNGTFDERADSVKILATREKKGWYATQLAAMIDKTVSIPDYILEAISFASTETINQKILEKIFSHRCSDSCEDTSFIGVTNNTEQPITDLSTFIEKYPNDMFSKLYIYKYRGKNDY